MPNELLLGINTLAFTSPFSDQDVGLFPRLKQMGYEAIEITFEEPGAFDTALARSAASDSGLALLLSRALAKSETCPMKNQRSDAPPSTSLSRALMSPRSSAPHTWRARCILRWAKPARFHGQAAHNSGAGLSSRCTTPRCTRRRNT